MVWKKLNELFGQPNTTHVSGNNDLYYSVSYTGIENQLASVYGFFWGGGWFSFCFFILLLFCVCFKVGPMGFADGLDRSMREIGKATMAPKILA